MQFGKTREILINQFVYTGTFLITEAIDYYCNENYLDFFSEKHPVARRPLPVSFFTDLILRRRICEYLFDAINERLLPENYYSNRFLPVRNLLEKAPSLASIPYREFLDAESEIVRKVNTHNTYLRVFIHTFRYYCTKRDHEDNPFEADIWELERFNLSIDRNYAFRLNKLNFLGIGNVTNKFIIKKYTEYNLLNTGLSVSHIYSSLIQLRTMLNMIDKAYTEWTQEDAKVFAACMIERYSRKATRISMIITLFSFTDYLLLHDFLADSPIKKLKDMARSGEMYQHNPRTVDNYVISQIYQALDKLNDPVTKIGFLLLHSVGMRCSEMLSLKQHCTEIRGENAFLNYYSPKMKKDVCNVIPLALAEIIEDYQNTLPPGEYLFPSRIKSGSPISYYRFSDYFNRFLKENHIANPDGTPYHFSSHSMRHQIAVRMRENNVPLKYIQEQLHHSNIDMTLQYVEYLDRAKIQKMTKYLDAYGNETDFSLTDGMDTQGLYTDYLRRKINAQILSDGICARPVMLGECPHGNCCLDCPEFRTSKLNLETHRQHLKRVNEYLALAEENGWLPQIEGNRYTKHKLERIIRELEALPDEFSAG